MKKGMWNEIVYRLADKGITEDHAALYIPHFQTGDDNELNPLEWHTLIQLLYDEAEKRWLDVAVETAYIERSYKG